MSLLYISLQRVPNKVMTMWSHRNPALFAVDNNISSAIDVCATFFLAKRIMHRDYCVVELLTPDSTCFVPLYPITHRYQERLSSLSSSCCVRQFNRPQCSRCMKIIIVFDILTIYVLHRVHSSASAIHRRQ